MFDEWAGSGATPGMAAGAGSACRPGEPVARPGGAAHPDSAGGACLVDRLVVLRAEAARREAEMLALMAEFVQTRRREDAGAGERFSEGFAVDELALALVTTRHRVHQQLHLAEALGNELAATGALLGSGRIDGYQAWVIHDMISRLVDDEHIAAVEADILARAPELTGGQIRSRLARQIAAREPNAFSRRHEQAMRDRRVSANAGSPGAGLDGMGSLWFSHAAVDITAIDDRITRLARAATRAHAGAAADGGDEGMGAVSTMCAPTWPATSCSAEITPAANRRRAVRRTLPASRTMLRRPPGLIPRGATPIRLGSRQTGIAVTPSRRRLVRARPPPTPATPGRRVRGRRVVGCRCLWWWRSRR